MLSDVQFRQMTLSDVDAGLRLCRLSHWNQLARDWEQFLQLEPRGAWVAEQDGVVIGSVATLRYGADVAWIAMVLVDPAARGHGVGTALLNRGLASLSGVASIGLDATPAGEPLYVTLGFAAVGGLTRLEREPDPVDVRAADADVRALSADDWADVLALDRRTTQLDRRDMLRWLAGDAPEYAWIARASGLRGFMLGRHGHNFEHLGPVIAADGATALRLVQHCVAQHPECRFIIDAADQRPGWHDALQHLGFVVQRPFTRMFRGGAPPAGDPAALFAIIGPEFG